jgi:hypothetical protein
LVASLTAASAGSPSAISAFSASSRLKIVGVELLDQLGDLRAVAGLAFCSWPGDGSAKRSSSATGATAPSVPIFFTSGGMGCRMSHPFANAA